jgi:hypothetical protein
MNGFKGRKTGLFKPVWLADRFPDGPGGGRREKGLFLGCLDSGLVIGMQGRDW